MHVLCCVMLFMGRWVVWTPWTLYACMCITVIRHACQIPRACHHQLPHQMPRVPPHGSVAPLWFVPRQRERWAYRSKSNMCCARQLVVPSVPPASVICWLDWCRLLQRAAQYVAAYCGGGGAASCTKGSESHARLALMRLGQRTSEVQALCDMASLLP